MTTDVFEKYPLKITRINAGKDRIAFPLTLRDRQIILTEDEARQIAKAILKLTGEDDLGLEEEERYICYNCAGELDQAPEGFYFHLVKGGKCQLPEPFTFKDYSDVVRLMEKFIMLSKRLGGIDKCQDLIQSH